MLRELRDIAQIKGEPRRRWFTDDFFDLIVWFDSHDEISGFQLCYNKDRDERALTWKRPSFYTHHRVDDGEAKPTRKATPILLADGMFDYNKIAETFKKESGALERAISNFVYEKLLQYGKAGG